MIKPDSDRYLITSQDQLPDFLAMSREEEAQWWETHDIAEGVLDSGPEVETEFERLLANTLTM